MLISMLGSAWPLYLGLMWMGRCCLSSRVGQLPHLRNKPIPNPPHLCIPVFFDLGQLHCAQILVHFLHAFIPPNTDITPAGIDPDFGFGVRSNGLLQLLEHCGGDFQSVLLLQDVTAVTKWE